jgi:hypothetical protein
MEEIVRKSEQIELEEWDSLLDREDLRIYLG